MPVCFLADTHGEEPGLSSFSKPIFGRLAASDRAGGARGHLAVPVDAEHRYAKIVELAWRAFQHLGVPSESLADAVQDALLVVHRRQAEFRGESTFQTWVYGIVLRVASNHRRNGRRAGAVFVPHESGVAERAASPEPSPLERLEQKAAAALLDTLLDELPSELREAFVLVELEELSLSAAATALGVRVTTCKSRLRSARRAFEAAVTRERARLSRTEGGR